MKMLAIGVVVVFVGFWMVQSPDSLAAFTRDAVAWIWDITARVFTALIDFLGRVFD